jgi:hypothetical protein
MSTATPTYVAIVDDDESLCRSLGRWLRASGLQPLPCLSVEAFNADESRPGFACLVLDVRLGAGMSVIELTAQFAAATGKPSAVHLHYRPRRCANACPGAGARLRSGFPEERALRQGHRNDPPLDEVSAVTAAGNAETPAFRSHR